MKLIKLLLLTGIGCIGLYCSALSQVRDTITMDSITKMKLDKKLLKMTKDVVLKHGPGYYRVYKEPVVKYKRISNTTRDLFTSIKKNNMGRVYYTVEYPYNQKEEVFNNEYSAKVYFWKDLTIFQIIFGHGMGILKYDTLSKAEKKNLIIPFEKLKPLKQIKDTIRDEKGKIIDVWNRYERKD